MENYCGIHTSVKQVRTTFHGGSLPKISNGNGSVERSKFMWALPPALVEL